jgi:hypothetical protein
MYIKVVLKFEIQKFFHLALKTVYAHTKINHTKYGTNRIKLSRAYLNLKFELLKFSKLLKFLYLYHKLLVKLKFIMDTKLNKITFMKIFDL